MEEAEALKAFKSQPYSVKVINASDQPKKAHIFDPKFQDDYIIIRSIIPNVEYKEMIYQNENNEWTCGLIIMEMSDIGKLNDELNGAAVRYDRYLTAHVEDKNGTKITIPQVVDKTGVNRMSLSQDIKIREKTFFSLIMPAESWCRFYFYPL